MTKPLAGVKVVELSMWAYVPSAGAVLADWGADVVKIESPSGDPIRGLVNAGVGPMADITFTWEIFNRNKKAIALDLTRPEAQEIVYMLAADADVFLTSLLPPARKKLGVDLARIREANPGIIYASGTGQGARGPEADRGGYDSITFWSRGSIAAAVTPPEHPRPVGMPAGAFGDSISGMALAGGVAAALVQKARTGEASVVDGSLLGTAMWAMQMGIVGAAVAAAAPSPAKLDVAPVANPLVTSYRTSDDRWVALLHAAARCLLGPAVRDRRAVRHPLRSPVPDPADRTANGDAAVAELETTFAEHPLAHWLEVLPARRGNGTWSGWYPRLGLTRRRSPTASFRTWATGRTVHCRLSPIPFSSTGLRRSCGWRRP